MPRKGRKDFVGKKWENIEIAKRERELRELQRELRLERLERQRLAQETGDGAADIE